MNRGIKIRTLYELISKSSRTTKLINGITLYRIAAAPILLILVFNGNLILFKWLLLISFFTDILDGYLARLYKVKSVLGAKLDSVGDDLTVIVAMAGLFKYRLGFLKEQWIVLIVVFILFLFQFIAALIRYKKATSFHTYAAKLATLFQGLFFISAFFFDEPHLVLFYSAAVITALELIEEIILVFILPVWRNDVRGLYWILK
jgi:phosphatidylglycerophosphate synthase